MKDYKKHIKITLLVIFVIVAGVFYTASFQRNDTKASLDQPPFISEVVENEVSNGEEKQSEHPQLEGQGVKDSIFVHVCGEVNTPGVYELAYDARVNDAIRMAGGFTGKAAKNSMNLALPLSDGQQIYILSKKEAKASNTAKENEKNPQGNEGNGASDGTSGGTGDLININTAGKEALMTLTGIGESKAQSIIQYREENGGFQTIEDLMKIKGIKEGVFNKIKDRITI